MNYGTVCSGIEALTVAVHDMDWKAKWFSEIEPFPCKLLKHHYSDVPNLGDMLKLENNETFQNESIDLLCGGTPCQSFSVAGLRGGLADVRGNLALEFCRILLRKKPRWFKWENVPGVLSSNGGQDFATIINAFSECGYSVAWRILDAQYFGVPQRRRRIFVIGYLGNDWRPPAAVLFERESLFRNIAPGKKEGKSIAGTVNASASRSRGAGIDPGSLIPAWWDGGQIAQTLDAVLHKGQTMPEKNRFPAVLYSIMPMNSGKDYKARESDVTQPLTTSPHTSDQDGGLIHQNRRVRRITPLEAERLQGFPDYYTAIPGAADSPRYKSIGNSMAIPVMRWLAKRIDIVDNIFNKV